jgi:hypothetical protein
MASPAEQAFREWAAAQGWLTTKRGWPDFICRRDGAVMAVEVKDGNDGLSFEQHQALTNLHILGMPTFVWTPYGGLRPYPEASATPDSVPALLLRVQELEQRLAAMTEERDQLRAGPTYVQPPIHVRNLETVARCRETIERLRDRAVFIEVEANAAGRPLTNGDRSKIAGLNREIDRVIAHMVRLQEERLEALTAV